MRVLKIGGNELSDGAFVAGLAHAVATIQQTENVVLVHGGGKAIADLQTRLNIPIKKAEGLRVTDAASLEITEMVLSGKANKLLVKALLKAGVQAIGISGVDGGLLTAQKKVLASADLGFVGTITTVNTQLLTDLLRIGVTPVVSPVSLGADGQTYNVNADEAASAIAGALSAEQLDFISNVPAVLNKTMQRIPTLTPSKTQTLIDDDTINGGMIPKVRSALEAVERGVQQARIVNLDGLLSGGGTVFSG